MNHEATPIKISDELLQSLMEIIICSADRNSKECLAYDFFKLQTYIGEAHEFVGGLERDIEKTRSRIEIINHVLEHYDDYDSPKLTRSKFRSDLSEHSDFLDLFQKNLKGGKEYLNKLLKDYSDFTEYLYRLN